MKLSLPNFAIERFAIKGLHGYKDVSISFAGKATVVVAENGSGKTTLLNALNAFLTRRFQRLNALTFSSIECQFAGEMLPLVLEKAHLGEGPAAAESTQLRELAEQSSLSPNDLIDFLQTTYRPGEIARFRDHPTVRQLYVSTPYGHDQLGGVLDELFAQFDRSLTEVAKHVVAEVRRCVGDVEVVYLPTYRRIERPLLRKPRRRHPVTGRTVMPAPSHRWNGSFEHDDMAFGLADVEQRLGELSEEIERKSNLEYRALSARMLEEMLRNGARRVAVNFQDLPDIESLTRFLRRVGRRDSVTSVFADIGNLYESREIESDDNWYVRYFLSRLKSVIDETRGTELIVEQFVSVCNSYLSISSDEKLLSLDPQTLRVIVQDQWAGRPISLDDLSSGEKQIVSLMARLYLDETPKLVLIDEPELSLSIDWQRKVLPDVIQSPTVVQMLAITHSPFVFENDLDEFARPLVVSRFEIKP
jgi:ABC-type molybdenum transport system ATPase subunit/photorepair protein PhrA